MNRQYSNLPSLQLGYEQIKNALQEQGEVARDYSNRAITIFAVSTAVLGIGLPLLFTRFTSSYLVFDRIPLTVLAVIPIVMFILAFVYFEKTYKMKAFITYASPSIIKQQFIELKPEEFYFEMMKHINTAFDKNETIIIQRERDLTKLISFTLLEIITLVILTLLFYNFRFLSHGGF